MDKKPFMYKVDNTFVGFHYELATEIAKKLDSPLSVADVPIMRMIEMLKKKEVELIICTENHELDDFKSKRAFLLKLETRVYTLKKIKDKTANNTPGPSPLEGRIARLTNGCVDLKDSAISWIDVESYEQAYNMLKAQRIDGVCGSMAFEVVNKNIHEFDITRVAEKKLWVHGHPDMEKKRWDEVSQAVDSLVKSGMIEALAKKYTK